MRKGPEHVPNSMLVLFVALFLFAVAMLISEALVESTGSGVVLVSVFVSVAGYGLYWIVLLATGHTRRFLPTVSCIMACGSILTILMVMTFVILRPIAGDQVAALLAWLVLMWSVPVKGHIIARAIEQHWYTGIAIAMTIYIVQRFAYETLTTTPAA
ncbi:MAG: hypothetical protein ACR2QR_08260 [Woeseiaceae bacterium]